MVPHPDLGDPHTAIEHAQRQQEQEDARRAAEAAVYDPGNIFSRILRGEIPCDKVVETPWALAFRDIHPQAPVHVIVIPKVPVRTFLDLSEELAPTVLGFWQTVATAIKSLALVDGGYRLITNNGPDAGQAVPHFHVHILGGQDLGPLVTLPPKRRTCEHCGCGLAVNLGDLESHGPNCPNFPL